MDLSGPLSSGNELDKVASYIAMDAVYSNDSRERPRGEQHNPQQVPSSSFGLSHSAERRNFARATTSRSLSPEEERALEDSLSSAPPTQSQSISLDVYEEDPKKTGNHQEVQSDSSFVHQTGEFPHLDEYVFVSYEEVDFGQKTEIERLLKKESSWVRSCCHKGLLVNLIFLVVMIIGIIVGEVQYPLEGVRGGPITIANDSQCLGEKEACITVRVVRAVGVFGFLGGVTNWIAVEMLFRNIPLLIGSGVVAKHYKEIREAIRRIVVETLFDPAAVREYFSGRKKNIREMLNLETHFGGLLESDAANQIIEKKIDSALARPEGFVLIMMGVDQRELKAAMRTHIKGFISEISPMILDRMAAPGITDGIGIQSEVERILEEKIEDLSAKKIKQLVAVMIRKHLSWIIVWGNLFGALIGLVAEVITVLVVKSKD